MDLEFRNFGEADLDYAIELTNSEKWYLTKYDLSFYMKGQSGMGLVALLDSERVGIATAAVYGKTAWVGNVIVDRERRQGGIGMRLVQELLGRLSASGVETILLYAYDRSKSLYERIGFKFDKVLWELQVTRPKVVSKAKFGQGLTDPVVEFDTWFFLQSRRAVLEHVAGREGCIVLSSSGKNGRVDGYLMCSPGGEEYGSEVAPFTAEAESIVPMLSALGDAPSPFHLYVPEENVGFLGELGLEFENVRRMHRGYLGSVQNVPRIDRRTISVGLLETG